MTPSVMHEAGSVKFPDFNNERHYMIPFLQSEGLPKHLQHWQETVDDMLVGIKTDQPIYFMADQAYVSAGETHRRPGVHVDGYWVPDLRAHSGGHLGHGVGGHGGHRSHGRHSGYGRHCAGKWDTPTWSYVDFTQPEAILLASNVAGARAWTGMYDERLIGDGGNADAVPVELLASLDMLPGKAYHGTVGTLHSSIPVTNNSFRSMVRLNCPGVTIN